MHLKDSLYLKSCLSFTEAANAIKSKLNSLKKTHPNTVGTIKLFDAKKYTDSYQQLINEFDNKWHIVHYFGHTFYTDNSDNAEENNGFLFFPFNSEANPVSYGTFGYLLSRKVELLFLNCCENPNASIAFLLTQYLPAVIGFLCGIDPCKIAEHPGYHFARNFYEAVLKSDQRETMENLVEIIEYAFLTSRQEIKRRFTDERIWIAPTLFVRDSSQ